MVELDGPSGPIRYQRDALGYPRIFARDQGEGAYALGALHATDRLVQVHIWLMGARGELLQTFGDWPIFRLTDRLTRSFGFQRDLDAQVAALTPETRAWLDAYADGWNSIANRRGRPASLRLLRRPLETFSARTVIELWRMGTFFGMTQMLIGQIGALAELGSAGASARAMSVLLGPDVEEMDLSFLHKTRFPAGLSQLAPLPVGSNAFAVSRDRSEGGALLMSEFHIQTGMFPPMVYPFHIDYADGSYYQGMGAPGLPWCNAGRTASVGWSTTFGHADTIHLAVERFSGGRYRVGDSWRTPTTVQETVRVFPLRKETWSIHSTDFGVVVADDISDGDVPCLRWSGLAELASDVNAYHRMFGARDVAEMTDVLRGVRSIGLEMALCDSSGNVAKIQTGQVERSDATDTPAYVQKGWELLRRPPEPIAENERPVTLRPKSGQVVCANQGAAKPWAHFAEPPYRFQRITAMLTELPRHSPSSLARISYDETDLSAVRLLGIWGRFLPSADPRAIALLGWARSQSGTLDDSGRAMLRLFHALYFETVRALTTRFFGQFGNRHAIDLSLYFQPALDDVLSAMRPTVLDATQLGELLAGAWPRALERAANPGFQVPVKKPFVHMFSQGVLPAALGFDTKPFVWPGGPMAPFQSRVVKLKKIEMVFGPGFHMVMDMAQRGAWYHVPGGASESRRGPGYGAGVDLYRAGRFVPLGDPGSVAPDVRQVSAELPQRIPRAV